MRLLEETVFWFTRQTVKPGTAELLILNDDPHQTLVCDVPDVNIVNLDVPLPTLGDKYNAMLWLARGAYIFPWEDDDISLPHRIEQGLAILNSGYDYFNPGGSWYHDGGFNGTLRRLPQGVCHNASCYRAGLSLYNETSIGQDTKFDAKMSSKFRSYPRARTPYLAHDAGPHDGGWSYVYRWGVSKTHLSSVRDPDKFWTNRHPSVPGIYRIIPRLHRDYEAEAFTLKLHQS